MRFVIVGAGLAGHTAAVHLRELAPQAKIDILGDELGLPYDRPPLSKEVLGEGAPRYLANAETYHENGISYHPGQTATQIDRNRSEILTACGNAYAYDRLLLATGSRARKLPDSVGQSSKILYLRTLEDAVRLKSVLRESRRIAVIGGGFIGLEVAAAARAMACEVFLFEMTDRILSRGMPAILSRWAEKLHRLNGVQFEFGSKIDLIHHQDDGSLRLRWNAFADVDAVVVGIGVQPNTQLASDAGLDVDDGIVVDDRCQTSDPAIFAAGEVTSHPVLGGAFRQRLKSWKVASGQSLVAAKSMAGIDSHYAEPPWLWSDQFGHNIQSLGVLQNADRSVVLDDPETNNWTAIFLDSHDKIAGAIAVNNGRDISMLKRAMLHDEIIPEKLLNRAAR